MATLSHHLLSGLTTTLANEIKVQATHSDLGNIADSTSPHVSVDSVTSHVVLGGHEIISITLVGLFVVTSLLIAALYYTYKLSPCCAPCRKGKAVNKEIQVTPDNLSEVFVVPQDPNRITFGRLNSESSIVKMPSKH